ncbi:hypothetical protein [Bradyrhizobium sp. USDA 4473]
MADDAGHRHANLSALDRVSLSVRHLTGRMRALKSGLQACHLPGGKRVVVMALAAAFACSGPSAGAADEAPSISLEWLTGKVYLVQDPNYAATNSLVYLGKDGVTVIGATWTPETAKQLAGLIHKTTTLPVHRVIVTSPDPEWAGGIAYWQGTNAEVVAARVTCEALRHTWDDTVKDFRSHFPSYPILPLALPSRCVEDRFSFEGGNIQLLYLGPSHTAADIFVYFPEEQILDAGSILKPFLGNIAKADIAAYPGTLRNLKALRLPTRMIIAGHWTPVHGPDLIDRYLGLLKELPNPR